LAGQAGDLHQTHGTAALTWAVVARIVRRVFRRRQLGHDHDRPEDQAASSSSHVRRIVRTPESQEVNWAAIDAREAVGADGELRVRELLSERLPAGMLILNNLELPELGGDIDLLIVGSTGLFVAEVKAWSGAISCSPDGRRWSRITAGDERQALPDRAAQVRREIGALRAFLQQADPELCRRTELWIDGFIVFAHPRARVDARCSPVPALSPDAAVARIRETMPRVRLSPADLDRIVALIESVQLNGLVRETQAAGRVVVHH
jgi:Nuclease-related domain